MGKSLVIVESPAKAKTVNKFLGEDYLVKASLGHVRDLPVKTLAVDVAHDFAPRYEIIKGREKVVAALKKAAKEAEAIYLAADPDREGEAICWHLAHELRSAKRPIHRVMFNEITRRAVQEAFAHPGAIDARKVDAQQARRILDRLVGYQISPLLWEKVRRGIAAGRVQSPAVRLVVEREREIRDFVPTEYWSITAQLAGEEPPEFGARLHRIDGAKASIPSRDVAERIVADTRGQAFRVASLVEKEKRRNPVPPFTTSKLQQEAARKLRFTARKTMLVAQQLYEGIEVGQEGAVGLITYMRTDSTRVSQEAQAEARRHIAERYGPQYLPERPPTYRSRKGAQEAHEAIRPTDVGREPASLAGDLTKDQLALYALIWTRFVASQMPPALFDTTTVEIGAGPYTFRATGQRLKFPGFTQVYVEGADEPRRTTATAAEEAEEEGEGAERALPALREGQVLTLRDLVPEQHFTQPPPRYSEASLVKELEERGIGRPSTYATILANIQEHGYVVKDEGKFKPTELGEIVADLLVENFPRIMDYNFTAQMEAKLDEIEEGRANWLEAMHTFYGAFSKWLAKARDKMTNVKAMEEPTDQVCEKCGRAMVIKWGRFGKFLACSGYPECKNTRELPRDGQGENGGPGAAEAAGAGPAEGAAEGECPNCGRPLVLKRGRFGPFLACSGYPECKTIVKIPRGSAGAIPAAPPQPSGETCERCGNPMVIKEGRYGRFLSCSTYPQCKNVRPLPIGVSCPLCGNPLAERRSKRGRLFYGCSAYPKCTFALWDRPLPEPCPRCGAKFLVEKRLKGAVRIQCATKGCAYRREVAPATPADAAAKG